ncbi:MAG: hypothetical protein ACO3JI_06615 [Steroidobacteraceae bacterium]
MTASSPRFLAAIVVVAIGSPVVFASDLQVDLEWVRASQGRNVVQVPNDANGTRFSLDALTGSGTANAPRLQLSWRSGEKQEWRLLAAPLSLSGSGISAVPIDFQGQRFASGSVAARYQFNSWRATWRYRWIDRDDLVVKVGATAKIRDASIRLKSAGTEASKEDTGFVPLLHVAVERPVSSRWRLEADVDALAGGPGYAIDAGLRIARDLGDGWSVHAGARYLDGGADNDEVYTFADYTSLTLGVSWRPR